MNSSLWIAKTGLDAQQMKMQVVSNNLANANTTGFKKSRASFEDLMYQTVRQVGGQTSQQTRSAVGMHLGTGVRTLSTEKMHHQGGSIQTNNQLDLSIQGKGFFTVRLPDGTEAYTRDGAFKLDEQGQLVTANGYVLQPGISIQPDTISITVGEDGTVSTQLPNQTLPVQVGMISLVNFMSPAGLESQGQNLYRASASSGSPLTGTAGINGLGRIHQGTLEGSNVNVVEELVNMIETQRGYEMNSKAISTSDQMLQYINNNL